MMKRSKALSRILWTLAFATIFLVVSCSKNTSKLRTISLTGIVTSVDSKGPSVGAYTDSSFLTGKKDDLLFNFKKILPSEDQQKIIEIICQNLPKGAWCTEILDYAMLLDGQRVGDDSISVTIKEGYEYICFRIKYYDKEKYELFDEYVYVEIIEVRLRVSNPKHAWIELEIVRLFPAVGLGKFDNPDLF